MLSTICSVVLSLSINSCLGTEKSFTEIGNLPVFDQYIADRREYESDYSREADRQRDEHRLRDEDREADKDDRQNDYEYSRDRDDYEDDTRYYDRDNERIYRDVQQRRQEIERDRRDRDYDYDYESGDRKYYRYEGGGSLSDIFND